MNAPTAAERIESIAGQMRRAPGVALAVPAPTVPATPPALVTFTRDQIKLMKRTICKPKEREATDDELALFVGQCKRTGLDPFSKQIYAIFRRDHGVEKMTVQTGIDGFRLIAERTGCYLGVSGTWWCADDGEWTETWIAASFPVAAKVTVRKLLGAHVAETSAVAHWDEYVDSNSPMWKTRAAGGMPANQLAKCAEALATRRAFPNDLSGIYTADEMGQVDARPLASAEPVVLDTPEVEPVDAVVVDDTDDPLMSEQERFELGISFEEAGASLALFLAAIGVAESRELRQSHRIKLSQKLAEHFASEVAA